MSDECVGGGREVATIYMADGAELPTHGECSACGERVPVGMVGGKLLALRHVGPADELPWWVGKVLVSDYSRVVQTDNEPFIADDRP